MTKLNLRDTKSACHVAYDGETGQEWVFPGGETWKVAHSHGTWYTGFKAVILTCSSLYRDITIVSFAGTDSALDAVVDVRQAFGRLPHQYIQAKEFLHAAVKDFYPSIFLTGHSLGGALAAYCAVSTLIPANTINPAPLVGAITMAAFGKNLHITNYISRGNEVVSSTWGRNPGIDVGVSGRGGFLAGHKLKNTAIEFDLPKLKTD